MKILLLTLLTAALLVSCAAPAPQPQAPQPQVIYSTPFGNESLAAQGVYFHATQVAFEAAVALATAQAVDTQSVAAATSQAVIVQFTSTAAAATAQADSLQFAIMAQGATQQAVETSASWGATQSALALAPGNTQAAAVATTQAQIATQAESSKSNNFYSIAIAVFILALMGIIVFYAWRVARAVARKASPENDVNQVRVLRLAVGTLILTPTRNGVERELIQLPSPSTPGELPDFEGDEENAEDIPLFVGGNLKTFFNRDVMNTEHDVQETSRARALKFLRRCIEVNGPESNLVPGHRALKMGGAAWQRAIATLSENIQTIPGVGTKLAGDFGTLAELYRAVGERRARLNVITLEHSPNPAQAERV